MMFSLQRLCLVSLLGATLMVVPDVMAQRGGSTSAGVLTDMGSLDNSYRIKAGDILAYRIIEEGGAVSAATVNDSGAISIPNLGFVQVAGSTPRQVAFALKASLEKSLLRKATVIVTVDRIKPVDLGPGRHQAADYAPTFVTIYGQVGRQGKLLLPEDSELTIAEAILQAGGFAPFAKTSRVEILRVVGPDSAGGKRRRIIVNVHQIMTKGAVDKDIPLRPDDVIIVGEKIFNF